jgi:hypothetical protein
MTHLNQDTQPLSGSIFRGGRWRPLLSQGKCFLDNATGANKAIDSDRIPAQTGRQVS